MRLTVCEAPTPSLLPALALVLLGHAAVVYPAAETGASSAKQGGDRQVRLALPLDLRTLPKLPSERFVVYAPQIDQAGDRGGPAWKSNTYHHNPVITRWKGRFFCAWTTSPQSEGTPPMNGLLSTSVDGENWSPAVQPPGWENLIPRGWHQTDERLYLWSTSLPPSVYSTADGETWLQVPPQSVRDVDFVPSNKKFLKLRDGRVMAFGMERGAATFPITLDPTGLTGWSGGGVDSRDCADVGEPGGWEGRDGVLHGAIRFGNLIWHTYSPDRGKTWTRLTQQKSFSDNPGNKEFGAFPDGSIWYVGNPKPGSRMELVLGISRDGWNFDQNYLVRWEPIRPIWYSKYKSEDRPGYEYPGAVYHDGYLYIAYARTRDLIEVCKAPVSSLLRRRPKSQ